MDKRDTLLIGSDMDSSRIALRDLFQNYYHILEASSADQARLLLQQNHSIISCVLLDIDHEWDKTYQLLDAVYPSADRAEVPVIVLVSSDAEGSEFVLLDTRATDVIRKPCPDQVLLRRVRSFADLYQERAELQGKLREKSELLKHSNDLMVDALSNIIEQRSLESGQHIQRIRGFTRILLEEIARSWPEYGLDRQKIERMAKAAALHDIGKISIPDAILNKPGYLTKEEFEIMQAHTVNGCEILEQLKGVADEEYLGFAYNICRHHHERWDGRGYPDGLRGDEIPICAQAAGVADVYDALTTDRVYKAAYPSERAATMILGGECGVFSPKILESFKACFPRFVELERYYKEKKRYDEKMDAPVIHTPESAQAGGSAADRLQAKYQALVSYQNATLLEADLSTGVFRLLYNPNADFHVPENAKDFSTFSAQIADEQIHPEDRERFIEELAHCQGPLFQLGQRRHSVYARMKGAATGEYRPYEFATIRLDTRDPHSRDVLLVCRPLDEVSRTVQDNRPEENPQVQAVIRNNLLFVRNDAKLGILGDIGTLYDLSGYTEQELDTQFGRSLMPLVHPEDRETLAKDLREQLAAGTTANANFRILAKDGRTVWALGRFCLYVGANGEEYFCALLQNDSGSHVELDRLRGDALYMEAFLRHTDEITFVWDIAAHECTFDEKWKQRFGHEPHKAVLDEELTGAHHIHPDDIHILKAFLEKLRAGGPYAEADIRVLTVRGGYQWNRFRAGVVCDADGNAVQAVGGILDIDELKRKGEAYEKQVQRMMESAWEGVLPGRHEHEALFEYVFRRFQEAEDLDAELRNVLRFMGSTAHVGRAYLYEVDAERGEYRKTAEWCAEGIVPLTDEQERLRYPMGYTAWEKMYDNNGVLCIPDTAYIPAAERAVTADLGVRAILQYKVESDGRVYGFIGLEDYNAPRIWLEEQIMGFHIFVKLLTLFLVRDREQKRARNSEEALLSVLNHQDAWAYIIDKDYGIQFLNEKIRGLVPAGRER